MNVAVGNVTIAKDVNVGVAAEVAAVLCGLDVGPIAVLGDAVDRSGGTRPVSSAAGTGVDEAGTKLTPGLRYAARRDRESRCCS